jgi:hypothetical protein
MNDDGESWPTGGDNAEVLGVPAVNVAEHDRNLLAAGSGRGVAGDGARRG